ncbi:MAG: hypothetical protein M1820_007723 [Bogoriella megaspora]|nr:MAG: hypothetical protein M1820_007723 [Bogoriella megaspora]
MAPQLPGMYYDAEKRKYFKIAKNHEAPQGAKYNRENVKREALEGKKRRIDETENAKRVSQTVQRSRALSNFGASCFRREIHGRVARDQLSSIYAARIGEKQSRHIKRVSPRRPWQINHLVHEPKRDIWMSAYNRDTEPPACALRMELSPWALVNPVSQAQVRSAAGYLYRPDIDYASYSHISSLHIGTMSNFLVGTTRGGYPPGKLIVANFVDSQDHDNFIAPTYVQYSPNGELSDKKWYTIRDSSPNSSKEHVALGTCSGVSVVHLVENKLQHIQESQRIGGDILTVEWLDSQIIIAKTSLGTIALCDTRTGLPTLQFRHANHTVPGIKCLPPSQGPYIIASAVEGSLMMYDIRMTSETVSSKPAEPVLKFQGLNINPGSVHKPSFDISPSTDLLATTSIRNTIELFSLRSARHLRTITPSVQSHDRLGGPARPAEAVPSISCLQFIEEPGIPSYIPRGEYQGEDTAMLFGRRNLNRGRVGLAASVNNEIAIWSPGDLSDESGM